MSDQLSFDAETAVRLERLYLSSDVRRRRRLATEALGPRPGQRLLDVGCGPGFHAEELAEAVGGSGAVIGVDTSETMLALARKRNRRRAQVEFRVGDATALPIPDESCDGLVAVQVYEYVPEIGAALKEAFRVLRPGGRIVVVDVDWATLSWHTANPQRMNRVLAVWDEHLAHPSLPRTLASEMQRAGFADVRMQGHAFVNIDSGPDGYSGSIIPLVSDYVTANGIGTSEAAEWARELHGLSESGTYYFSLTKFVFDAQKPNH
jgi:SAM-dependent methyltransferase